MGLNFLAVPTVEGVSSTVSYSLRSRWRSPRNGPTTPPGKHKNGIATESDAAAEAEFPQIDGHSMAIISDYIAHAGSTQPLSLISHARHLLS